MPSAVWYNKAMNTPIYTLATLTFDKNALPAILLGTLIVVALATAIGIIWFVSRAISRNNKILRIEKQYRAWKQSTGDIIRPVRLPIHLGEDERGYLQASNGKLMEPHVALAAGTLYLTDQRLLFVGPTQTRTIALDDVIAFHPSPNAFSITVQGMKHPLYFKDLNGLIFADTFTSLQNNIA